jgi:hypothetical protein
MFFHLSKLMKEKQNCRLFFTSCSQLEMLLPIQITKATNMSHLKQYVAYNILRCRTSVNTFYRLPLVFNYLAVHDL